MLHYTETQKRSQLFAVYKTENPCLQKYVREELITSQIAEKYQKSFLPPGGGKLDD